MDAITRNHDVDLLLPGPAAVLQVHHVVDQRHEQIQLRAAPEVIRLPAKGHHGLFLKAKENLWGSIAIGLGNRLARSKVASWFSHSLPGYFSCHWDRLCTTTWQLMLKPRMLLRASAMPSM